MFVYTSKASQYLVNAKFSESFVKRSGNRFSLQCIPLISVNKLLMQYKITIINIKRMFRRSNITTDQELKIKIINTEDYLSFVIDRS